MNRATVLSAAPALLLAGCGGGAVNSLLSPSRAIPGGKRRNIDGFQIGNYSCINSVKYPNIFAMYNPKGVWVGKTGMTCDGAAVEFFLFTADKEQYNIRIGFNPNDKKWTEHQLIKLWKYYMKIEVDGSVTMYQPDKKTPLGNVSFAQNNTTWNLTQYIPSPETQQSATGLAWPPFGSDGGIGPNLSGDCTAALLHFVSGVGLTMVGFATTEGGVGWVILALGVCDMAGSAIQLHNCR